ncbi:MAG: tRNA (N(6)-L-threonylcarbamoyladenosine(37)-C(2))-methylthiotransferase MtaB [Bacilli bacterium]|nr:tRNA (N(6)-L-threonylcarbamoyladenosine(37)-C(2))-methylthiotransferase MtaB [Bacilli bacterium]
METTFFIHTLGCKVNSYESYALGEELKRLGYVPTSKKENAGILILNTCSVTGKADAKSRQHLSSMRKASPHGILLVMGCHSQGHAEACAKAGADIVLGASSRAKAIPYIQEFEKTHRQIVDVKPNLRHEDYEELGTFSFGENARAYLKIQDGCDNFCSYCYIPFLRGNSRSRLPGEVIKEAKALVDRGYQELILTGIHLGGYGKDLGDGSYRLSTLIKNLLLAVPELFRLRISSIEESEIDDELIALLRDKPQIASHLHIPLQSGSKTVLERMKRKYDKEGFLRKLAAIRAARPEIAITTDVIAGFPLESDEEWAETMDFCKECGFAEIHVFPFSSRPKTYAATLPDLSPEIKKKRVAELLALSKSMRAEYEARFEGVAMPVLFEDFDAEKHLAYGHTSNYLKVGVPAEKPRHGEVETIIYESSIAAD